MRTPPQCELVGDALATLNIATGQTAPAIPAGCFNVSSELALDSLHRLAGLDGLVLPGHGDPWGDGTDGADRGPAGRWPRLTRAVGARSARGTRLTG